MPLVPSPHIPQPTSSNFTHKVPTLFIFSVWAYSVVVRPKAEVCEVKELTLQSNPQLMRDGRQSSDEIIVRYILCSFSDLQQEIIYYFLPSLSCFHHIHYRIIFQINYLHPRFCLRVWEEPKLRLVSASRLNFCDSSCWLQRKDFSSLFCSSFPWNSIYFSLLYFLMD